LFVSTLCISGLTPSSIFPSYCVIESYLERARRAALLGDRLGIIFSIFEQLRVYTPAGAYRFHPFSRSIG
jgi:hypothetical protein